MTSAHFERYFGDDVPCSICHDLIQNEDGLGPDETGRVTYEDIKRSCATTACPYCCLWEKAIDSFPEISRAAGRIAVNQVSKEPLQLQVYRKRGHDENHTANGMWWNLEIYSTDDHEKRMIQVEGRPPFSIGTGFGHVLPCCPTSGGQCLDRIKEWLVECLAGHPNYQYHPSPGLPLCTPDTTDPTLPTRVLCLDTNRADPYLIETSSLCAKYTALSYCWGNSNSIRTTMASLSDFKQKIPLEVLPKTMRDAVTVTKYLGINYLWIDALCIIQDSVEDWISESAKMGLIYRNATLVIAASDSPDCNHGLFYKRVSSHVLEVPLPGAKVAAKLYVRPRRERYYPRKETSRTHIERLTRFWGAMDGLESPFDGSTRWFDALGRRGWVYQEHNLACRIVHFTRSELGWSCSCIETCECTIAETAMRTSDVAGGRPPRFGSQIFAHSWEKDVRERWRGIVEDYTKLKLTKATDLLPALAGIASSIIVKGDKYLFGLWRSGIEAGDHLCWYVRDPTRDRGLPIGYAPSWTWASVHGSISFQFFFEWDSHRFTYEFVDCSFYPSSANPFGPGTGHLRLRGSLIPIHINDECGFYTKGRVEYKILEKMACLLEEGKISDPNLSKICFPQPGETDLYGKTIGDRPEILQGELIPDTFPFITEDNDMAWYFFILAETVEAYSEMYLHKPRGLILQKVQTQSGNCYRRLGWGDSWANMPTEWWKTCGDWEMVVII